MTGMEKLRLRLAGLIAPKMNPLAGKANTRMYSGAMASRLTEGWGNIQTSGDSEISSSLRPMRQRCRALIRDAGFAKRAKTLVVGNVVGSGIGMQAQVRTSRWNLNERVNEEIESLWESWTDKESCHTGGKLSFSALEQFCMGQVFDAGEIFIRKHFRPFGNSKIPYALEVIESERVLDEFQPTPVDPSKKVRLGVEMDDFSRPVAYYIRKLHPGDMRYATHEIDMIERVPASQIIHLHIVERWPQTRGVPWMHTAMRKLNDLDGYTYAEIVRARDQASVSRALKTSRDYGDEVKDENGNVTQRQIVSEPGTTEILYNDEEMQFPPPSSPNASGEGFLRFMLREIAAGTGPSYGDLSRDRSQGTYSSERQDLLTDRDLWRIFQLWFIGELRMPVHRDFVQQGVLSRQFTTIPIEQYALDQRKFEKVRFKPRGWSWIDPAKEVSAYKEAIMAGLTTQTDVIAKTADGRDMEDILEERAQELALKQSIEKRYAAQGITIDLTFDTDPKVFAAPAPVSAPKPAKPDDDEEDGQDKQKDNKGRMHALRR